MHAASEKNSLQKYEVEPEKEACVASCETCKQHTGRGIRHRCTIASSSNNILKQVRDLPDRQREQIVTGLLKELSKEEASKSGSQSHI